MIDVFITIKYEILSMLSMTLTNKVSYLIVKKTSGVNTITNREFVTKLELLTTRTFCALLKFPTATRCCLCRLFS